MTSIDFKTILQERVDWQGTQTGRFRMTDKEKLMTVYTDAAYAYNDAVEEERAAAKKLAAELKTIAIVGEQRRNSAALKRLNARQAYLRARDNYEGAKQ